MLVLNPAERRALRAKAHALHPVVSVGQHGLTPPVLHEIDLALTAHGLIKVRVHSEDRGDREAMLVRIATELEGAPVQHLGKLLILWRPQPTPETAKQAGKTRKPSGKSPKARRGTSGDKPVPRQRRRPEARASPAGRGARGSAKTTATKTPSNNARTSARRPRAATVTSIPRAAPKSAASSALRQPRGRSIDSPGAKPFASTPHGRSGASSPAPRAALGKSSPNPRRRRAR